MPAITLCTNKCSIFLSRLLISQRCLACWDGEGLQEKEEEEQQQKTIAGLKWHPLPARSATSVGNQLRLTVDKQGFPKTGLLALIWQRLVFVHVVKTHHPSAKRWGVSFTSPRLPADCLLSSPQLLCCSGLRHSCTEGILESGGFRSDPVSVVGLEVQCEGYCIYSAVCSC